MVTECKEIHVSGVMNKKQKQYLHFLTHASEQAGDWPFYQAMRHAETSVTVFGNSVSLKYPHRVWLYLIGWPRLLWSGLQMARKSLRSLDTDTIVTVHDHILLLTYKIARLFSRNARKHEIKLVLHGFIYTPRSSRFLNTLRGLYFRLVLRNVAMIVCHSRYEVPALKKLVEGHKTIVEPVLYGIGEGAIIKEWFTGFTANKQDDQEKPTYSIVTAGRSSRDYGTLVKAVEKLPANITCDIICDNVITAPNALASDKVSLHRSVYGSAYTQMLIDADIVVVPLGEEEISAGQMVLLHALAAAKPVIITNTPTSSEYVEPSILVKLVRPKDPEAMHKALKEVTEQLPLTFSQRMALRQLFEDRFSDIAHGRKVFNSFQRHLF